MTIVKQIPSVRRRTIKSAIYQSRSMCFKEEKKNCSFFSDFFIQFQLFERKSPHFASLWVCCFVCYDSHFPSHFHHHSLCSLHSLLALISFYIDNLVFCHLLLIALTQHTIPLVHESSLALRLKSLKGIGRRETTTQDATKINGPLAHLHFCFTVKKEKKKFFVVFFLYS